MNGQLFTELKALAGKLQCFSSTDEADIEAMSEQLRKEWPAITEQSDQPTRDIAATCLTAIQTIPKTVELLIRLLEEDTCKPEMRHAIVLALVYLARSDDLVPDDTPGGYGYVDDYIAIQTAVVSMLCVPDVKEWILRTESSDSREYEKLKNEVEAWRVRTVSSVGYLMIHSPPERRDYLKRVFLGTTITYNECCSLAAANPESLEHRTRQLIDNPRLSDPVLTYPVDDDSLWEQWEKAEAQKLQTATTTWASQAMQEARKWAEWSRRPSAYKGEYLIAPLPGGGFVAAKRR